MLTLNQLLDAVRALPAEDRQRLRDMIDVLPGEPTHTQQNSQMPLPILETELEQFHLQQGVIRRIPPRPAPSREDLEFKPVPITGKPLSETVIEERR